MIFFFSDGRLGNQIFQLAFLREISKSSRQKIITFNLGKMLDVFDLDLKINNLEVENKKWQFVFRKLFFYFFELLSFFRIITIIYEDLDSIKYNKKNGLFWFVIYVRTGFFQSERFFDGESFLKNIKMKKCYMDKADDFCKKIPANFTKIFLHVRRGDYLTVVHNNKKGINLPIGYYSQAMEFINKKINNPFYIILSDDVEFVEIAFEGIENKIISYNSSAVDLAIMSLCEGGITSNSSYSWWGAFLLKNRDLVVMPKYWCGWKDKIQSHKGIDLSSSGIIEF